MERFGTHDQAVVLTSGWVRPRFADTIRSGVKLCNL